MWTLLIALVLAAPPQAPTPAAESDRRADTYAVYSALMSSNPSKRDAANPTYVIEATTFVPVVAGPFPGFSLEGCVTPPPSHAASWMEVLAEAKASNIAPGILEPALKLSRPYMLLSANEVADFRSAFPRAIESAPGNLKFGGATDLFRLSVVYFNKNRTLALMYSIHTCGMLCGEARWAIFEKLPLLDGQSVWIKRPDWVRCVINA